MTLENKANTLVDQVVDELPFLKIATEIGLLVGQKNAAYGNAVDKAGKIMAILYPEGIPVAHQRRAIVLSRIAEKMSRAATANDPFGEDPMLDIAGLAIVELHNEQKDGPCQKTHAEENLSTGVANVAAKKAASTPSTRSSAPRREPADRKTTTRGKRKPAQQLVRQSTASKPAAKSVAKRSRAAVAARVDQKGGRDA